MQNIIQTLNEQELEYAHQNVKQQAEVINESLKLMESRTRFLISFLVVLIIFYIGILLLQDISLYVKICVDVAILFYTFIISIIVHCYFSKELPSQVPKTESILEFIRYYKQINIEESVLSTKKDILHCMLTTTIPELNTLMEKRANIFNYSIKTVFAFFAITNIAICILTF